jgi:hypothetical protein
MNIYEQILFPVVEEYNQTFDQSGQLLMSETALLSGPGGALDSLELINFIIILQRRVQAVSGQEHQLVTDEALSMKSSPFLTLKSLAEFLQVVLGTEEKK